MGDFLAGSLNRELIHLSKSEQVMRDERTLDAMLEASAMELDAISRDLDIKLKRAERKTWMALQKRLLYAELVLDETYNHTVTTLNEALAPQRESVQADLQRTKQVAAAREEAKRRKAWSTMGARATASWRDPKALARFESTPTHPVVLVCEGAALLLSGMMLLAAIDMSSPTHAFTTPPQIARVQFQQPQRTAVRASSSTGSSSADSTNLHSVWENIVDSAAAPAAAAPSPSDDAALSGRAHTYWLAARGVFLTWLASFMIILTRSGTDEWATLALGLQPVADENNILSANGTLIKTVPIEGLINWEYDWERDTWRQN